MSPLPLRRYRAERLLREEFERWREEVLAAVRARIRARGVQLDGGDLEACYAHAWQGLYAALLAGREVANPVGWLKVVTFRRAIDEHRARTRLGVERRLDEPATGETLASASAVEYDLAAELDDRARLRHVFEALRGSLSARECEAASLCYLQGLPRAEAAERMGIGEKTMRKLMEGRGPGRPGVASKVGELLGSIRGGGWCEQQVSLMRAFAFGVLDPDGERYQLALAHRRECPACRRYVLSLRGLAAVLPPLVLPWGVGVGVGAGAGAGGAAGAGGGSGVGAGTSAGTGAGLGLGTGAGAAKLAVGCVLALGVGCAAVAGLHHRATPAGHSGHAHRGGLLAGASVSGGGGGAFTAPRAQSLLRAHASGRHGRRLLAATTSRAPAGRESAQREFGIERGGASRSATPLARASRTLARGGVESNGDSRGASSAGATATSTGSSASSGADRAEREFAP
ncbi:MAG TPA: sigma-70 family RNA polymerase sigma factor [Solirubrobacteraceae bacterium]|jgi:DNA-directed RNA polymerase specialized sigma24 family protein